MDEEVSNSLSTSLSFSQSPILTLKSPIKLTIGLLDNVEEEADLIYTKPNTKEDNSITVLKCTNEEEYQVMDSVFPNDPVHWPETMSNEILTYFMNLGPYGNLTKRTWLSYSPLLDRVFCMSCRLFSLVKAKKSFLSSKGTCDYRNIAKTIHHHECLPEHIQSEISRGLYFTRTRIDITLLKSANHQVAENREILKVIIDALLFTARQNIALRGHDESNTSMNKGNFLELLKLLSKHHGPLNSHLQKIEGKHNRVTFLSSLSQNKLLSILSVIVRSKILFDVKKSGLFSVIIDTTTDVSTLDQFTFLLRYVNDKGKIEERLVALVTSPDSTGKGMYEVFCNITEKYNINWKRDLCAQAYDGAASMQGQYSGLKTLIQNENPNALYVWCSAHLLNLVIVDTCDCCTKTKVFFGDIKALVEFMCARKRTATFVFFQNKLYPNERVRRLKRFSTTRWTSHDRVITVVYEKYAALLQSLNAIASAEDSDRESSSTAKSLSMRLSSFEFIIAMNLVKTIFAITTPVSNYLQSKSIDFIEAINLVDVAKNRLIDLRDDDKCQNLINEAKSFAKDQNLTERNFKEVRLRKKKIMPGELSRDEISSTAQDVFRSDVYFKVLDVIINSIESRFKDSREIMKDLCLLSPERLLSYSKKNSKKLPEDAFDQLAKWIHGINLQDLRVEYLAFSSSLHELVVRLEPKQLHENVKCIQSSEDSDSSITSYEDDRQVVEKKVSVERILHILSSYNLISAFPNLYKAYKSLGTIPASSASAERSFSKVKLIKTRLRSTTGQDRLESLLILSMEKDIEINYNEAINTFAMTSDEATHYIAHNVPSQGYRENASTTKEVVKGKKEQCNRDPRLATPHWKHVDYMEDDSA
ncbi:zinc finger MYM-type protein 1-like [Acyrthosiphon pisum]|uniref:Zinc finger MYM-type protein 1-like n=1 Tax=Acyrthosiphon pisum TaxID=7029 RepID=A0A8R2NKL6_ACYPI|nr:zinc finger MYM-type protein 1-like [Acyrthosiphon pisum]